MCYRFLSDEKPPQDDGMHEHKKNYRAFPITTDAEASNGFVRIASEKRYG
jgi:hypothetical protein